MRSEWYHDTKSLLYPELDETPLQSFEQINDIIWFMFSENYYGCYVVTRLQMANTEAGKPIRKSYIISREREWLNELGGGE